MSDQHDTENPDRRRLDGDLSDVSHTPPEGHEINHVWRRGDRRGRADDRAIGADDRAAVRRSEDRPADE